MQAHEIITNSVFRTSIGEDHIYIISSIPMLTLSAEQPASEAQYYFPPTIWPTTQALFQFMFTDPG